MDLVKKVNSQPPITTSKALALVHDNKTKQELACFYYAILFSPVKFTLLWAIKRNHFVSLSESTYELISKHLTKSIATSKEHKKLQRQGIKSTKIDPSVLEIDAIPAQKQENKRTDNIFMCVCSQEQLEKSYSGQIGRFPVRSARGNQCVFVLYNYDTNIIHTRVIEDKQSQKNVDAWTEIHNLLKMYGHESKVHILDNECSFLMKATLKNHNVKYKFVLPYTHRRNVIQRVIQTWKYHFLSGLVSCDPNFPIREWDRLLKQGKSP